MICGKRIVLCIALFIGYASAQGVMRILGGNSALIEHYPYQASLQVQNRHFCGGSIISKKHILTAAHCINQYMVPPFQNVLVITGTSYKDKGGQSHRISKIDVHPGWRPVEEESYPNDLAVITLKDEIVFDEYQQKIDLPDRDFEDGRYANLTGWGLTNQLPPIRPRQLQMIKTELVSQEKCEKKMSEPGTKIYDTQVCAFRSRGSGACSGDSGGPLAADGQVVGIVSWVDGDYCAAGVPEVYTNVYKFKGYIENILSQSQRCGGIQDFNIKDFPYQVSLRLFNSHTCGGSIISERHILTAAHCINRYMSPPYTFARVVTLLCTSYVSRGGQSHRIPQIDVHPGWVSGGQDNRPHDIAIVTLKDRITFDEHQQKISLPEHDFEEGAKANNLTGWGLIKLVPPNRPTQLQMIETTLTSLRECQEKMPDPEKTKIFDTQVCAFRSYGRGPCFGDSGGPLVVNGEVVGIVSYGDGDRCAVGIPDAYTNVYSYKTFITSKMSKND